MKELIKKLISEDSVSQNDVTRFIVEFTELFERPIKSPQEVQAILQLMQIGEFKLMYAIKLACIKLDIPLRILYDANGQVIKKYIQE